MSLYPEDNDSEDEGEIWLVSYADMMTLIACFFILMMAFANFDPIGFSTRAEQMSKAFRKEKAKTSDEKLKLITEEMSKHPEILKKTKISYKPGSLKITFHSSVLFKNNDYKIAESALPVMDGVIDIIKIIDNRFKIVIEGHADESETAVKFNKSKWTLSSARSSEIIRRFEYFGFDSKNIVSIGYGASKPLVNSKNEDGTFDLDKALLNRRVVIKVLKSSPESKKVKMGLGVYFDNKILE